MNWEPLFEPMRILGTAAGLGAILGLERELARRPAGLRTHILVAVAAALLMILGENIIERFTAEQGHASVSADPIRVIQAIIVGISFLGTGTIIHEPGARVEGLTTAASILLTAAIAIAVAADQAALAAVVTVAITVILLVLGWTEKLLGTDQPPRGDDQTPAKGVRPPVQTGG
jgi:putative Mg2+ transporter-C (MgtC) family protein